MELLVILALFLLIIIPLEKYRQKQYALSQKENSEKPEKRCPPHKWSYDSTGRMFCDWCRNPPGYFKSENGEYGG